MSRCSEAVGRYWGEEPLQGIRRERFCVHCGAMCQAVLDASGEGWIAKRIDDWFEEQFAFLGADGCPVCFREKPFGADGKGR